MKPIIRVENLTHTYGENTPFCRSAVKDVDMEIYRGEFLGIIGHTGSGKSTLIQHLNGLLKPTGGTITLDGRDIWADPKRIREVRFKVGLVFQYPEYQLFEESVYKDIAFGPRNMGLEEGEIDRRVRASAAFAGLGEELLDKSPFDLSGGQKQRVAIARTLATSPKVLLCDEATSALDPKTTRDILRLIQDINRRLGITVVVITHEMKVIEEICSRVAILDRGRLAETGAVEEVFARPKSEAGRRLVYPDGVPQEVLSAAAGQARVVRVAFNGGTSYQPLIATLAIECGVKANILGADTRNIDGRAFGTMLLGLPEDGAEKALGYIRAQRDITVEEVPDYHG